ncbi:glycoside hydrolase family 30 protein [Mucilaginibacter sp. X5P1]|uniref:glycoside hydrolase family 30 protein n=1 Tax=Mucilaginibacter sp. X5P1 TaxID=2723088 RepID=UPI00162259B5|nr:glycoside hydrolase family 30 protein [Mucilaginibacter sp. X5P1]MBB6138294.1 glucosylceramidase [Mucilaginibacter sp. X5P1]
MKKKILGWLSYLPAFFLIFPATLYAQTVTWVTSTENKPWVQVKAKSSVKGIAEPGGIKLFPDEKLQEIDGFGGCFNEIGWEALLAISPEARRKILQDLFSVQGANFSICRVPIGASDYALSWYSYDDVPDDFSMRNFNIDRDRYILIPYIKAAQLIRPDLKFWGSPWSPPIWMKVNNHYALTSGGSNGNPQGDNRMASGDNIENNATAFRMEKGYLEAYALYFSKYVKAYQKESIALSAIDVQNEIAYAPQWPSCTWHPEDLAWFIKKYLGPQFKKDSLKTQIWLGTINYGNPDYVRKILNDTAAARYIAGVGFQWAGKSAIKAISKEYPGFRLMQTESECGNGENNWKAAEHTWGLMTTYLNSGANSYMYWNMVLDQSGKSSWGWAQNSLVSVNNETKEVHYTPEYYLMKHLSHFVLPGAHMIRSSDGNDHLSFINPDGSIVLLLANLGTSEENVTVEVNQKTFMLSLKAKSFNTITWKP